MSSSSRNGTVATPQNDADTVAFLARKCGRGSATQQPSQTQVRPLFTISKKDLNTAMYYETKSVACSEHFFATREVSEAD